MRISKIMTVLAMLVALQFQLTKAYSQVNLLEYPGKPVHLLPEVPTVEEAAGLPGYEALAWYGLLGPQVMPSGAAEKLNSAIQRKLLQPDVKLKLLDQGCEAANTTTADFRKFLIADMEKWAKVVKSSGATAH